jgi:putative ABC transport system permease protein
MSAERAERRYRGMLRLLPQSFREESENELLEVFRAAYAGRRVGRVRFWSRITADLLLTALAEAGSARGSGVRTRRDGRAGRGLGLDLAQSLRRLRQEPGHAAASTVALGVGLAAAGLVLTLVRGVLLTPLPFPDPDRLVRLIELDSGGGRFYPSFPNISDWRENARIFEGVAAADVPQVRTILHAGGAVRGRIGAVSRDFFRLLGVTTLVGRTFTPAENARGGPPVALVSEEFWRGTLGAQPLDGLSLAVGAETFAVVGVLPAGFRFLGDAGAWSTASVWLPLERDDPGPRQSHGYHTVARLRPGITLADARAQMNQLALVLKQRHGEETQADQVQMTLLTDDVLRQTREPLQLLSGAALFVLLVTCFNLGAAVLGRGLARAREMAVRSSLGASRLQLVRHLLVESSVIAVPGAVLAVVLTYAGLAQLQRLQLSIPRLDEVRVDGGAVVFTLALALLVTAAAGAFPALVLSARNPALRLRAHGATSPGREHRRLWMSFIAVQIALALALVCGTTLLTRSLQRLVRTDMGYDADRLIAVDVSLPETRYASPERRLAWYAAALGRIRALPGVEAAGLTGVLPDETTSRTATTLALRRTERTVYAGLRLVDPGYFRALGLTWMTGEPLDPVVPRPALAVIDAGLARQLWNGDSPVGSQLWNSYLTDTLTVVGTVSSVREWNELRSAGAVYVDYRAHPDMILDMHFVVRPATASVLRSVRTTLEQIDPLVPVTLEPLRQRIARTYAERRLLLLIAASFAATTLLLAALGVYGVVAWAVGRERRSVAIRLVLGAHPGRVVGSALSFGLLPTALGLAAGLVLTVPALWVIRSQLTGVAPLDPLSMLIGILVLAAGATLAAWLPARTLLRVDPRTVLRQE